MVTRARSSGSADRKAPRRRPARILRRRRAGDRRRREGPGGLRRPGLRPKGDHPQPLRRRGAAAQGSDVRGRGRPGSGSALGDLFGAWISPTVRAAARKAAADDRRDLSPRDQGPPRGDPLCEKGYTIMLDRPPGARRDDRHPGRGAGRRSGWWRPGGRPRWSRSPIPTGSPYLTQTTLSLDDTRDILDVLKRRFPRSQAAAKGDICYATQNRQDAVKAMARRVDTLLVLGAPNSSNSLRTVRGRRGQGGRRPT